MAGRFPLFTDACVNGHLVEALIRRGWDLVRVIDLYPERTPDPVVFARAAHDGRVFVSNDGSIEQLAPSWLLEQVEDRLDLDDARKAPEDLRQASCLPPARKGFRRQGEALECA